MGVIRKRAVYGKVEVTEGTWENLAVGDGGVEVYEARFEAPAQFFDRNPLRNTLSRKTAIPGPQIARLAFRCELKGSPAAGTPPTWGKYMKACGFKETIVAVTSVTYDPVSAFGTGATQCPSLSLAMCDDGQVHQMKGARGNVSIGLRNGEPGFLQFTFEGVYHGTVDLATPAFTYADAAVVPLAVMGANIFTVQTFNPVLASLDLDIGNNLRVRPNANSVAGLLSAMITSRDPKGTIDPEMTTVASHDWYGKFRSGATGVLTLNLTGSAGNRIALSAPVVQYRELSDAEREGISARSVGLLLAMNAGDDEISIAIT
jgi:hypothetical protein